MKRGRVVFIIGVSACGKSTIARGLADQFGAVFLEGDSFHSFQNIAAMRAGHPLTDEMRWGWLTQVGQCADEEANRGRDVVVACSALKKAYRDVLRQRAEPCEMVLLQGSPELILSRMKTRRDHYMPADLLASQFKDLEIPNSSETGTFSVPIDRSKAQVLSVTASLVFSGH